MASKNKSVFICSQCGFESPKWYGKCPECSEWNTFEETIVKPPSLQKAGAALGAGLSLTGEYAGSMSKISDIDAEDDHRYKTGLGELDRVMGGGIVKGSLVLLGGDPGIGKSTLLLQICQYIGSGLKVLYVSGEESVKQIKLRALRLKVSSENLFIAAETDLSTIINLIMTGKPDIVIIDSIQTMNMETVSLSESSQ